MFLSLIFLQSYCYGQRIINGIETWTATGITTQGTPSSGQTPTLVGGTYNVPFDIVIRPGATLIFSNCTVQMGSSTQANLQRGMYHPKIT